MPIMKTCVTCAKEPDWKNTEDGETCTTLNGEKWVDINNPYMMHDSCPAWEKKPPIVKNCVTCEYEPDWKPSKDDAPNIDGMCKAVPDFIWHRLILDKNKIPLYWARCFESYKIEDCNRWERKV